MILVLGATGTIGQSLVDELVRMKLPVCAAVHRRPLDRADVESVRVDLTTGEGLDAALHGIRDLFLLTGDLPDPTAAELRVVEAAQRHDVERIVKVSVMGAATESFSFARIHRPVGRAIKRADLAYTFLRPNAFMQNFITYHTVAASHGSCRAELIAA